MPIKRLTIDEMNEKYPEKWLFIVDCEYNPTSGLVSGVVHAHSKCRKYISKVSMAYKGSAAIRYTGTPLKGKTVWI